MLLSSFVFLLAALPVTVPPAMPPVLLDAPVNATWCANHADHWAALGFEGFLFRGIVNLADGREEDKDSHLIHRNDPLLREIALARQRLAAAGLEHHFLQLALPPDQAWFSDRALGRVAEQRFRRAGAFARDAELRGVAIDLSADGPLYDFRWEAYAIDERGVRAAREAARNFGRRSLRAVIREFRDTELLILAPDPATAGPLALELLAGMLDAAGLADSVQLQIAVATNPVASHTEMNAALDRIWRHLDAYLGEGDSADAWRALGGIAPRLRPVDGDHGLIAPGRFREQILAAKLRAPHYLVCSAERGMWHTITPEEAGEYRVLQQQGEGAVRAATAVENAEEYSLRTALDGLRRIGTPADHGPGDFVLAGPDSATALLWEGLPAPMRIASRTGLVRAEFIEDGSDMYFTPRDGVVAVPELPGPVVLSGLPLAEWAIPAGMTFTTETPIAPGGSHTRARLRVMNPTPLKFTGTLEADPTPGASIGAPTFQIRLDPGESRSFERSLRGAFVVGESIGMQLNLLSDTGAVFQRSFTQRCAPKAAALHWRDGAIAGMPAVADLNGDGDTEIVINTVRGELAVYEIDGTLRWERRYRTGFVTPPIVATLPKSGRRIVATDDERRVWVMDVGGGIFHRVEIDGDAAGAAAYLPEGGESLYGIFAVPLRDGRVTAVSNRGTVAWTVPVFTALDDDAKPQLLGAQDGDTHLLYAYLRGTAADALVRLDATGHVLWQQSLDAPLSAAPVFVATAAAAHLAAPLANGGIQFLDAWTGASEYLLDPGDGKAAHALLLLPGKGPAAPELLALYDSGLRRLTLEGEIRAASPMAMAPPLQFAHEAGVICRFVAQPTPDSDPTLEALDNALLDALEKNGRVALVQGNTFTLRRVD